MLTSRETPFEASLDWLQFAYTDQRAGAYVTPVSTVLTQFGVAEGDELSMALMLHLRRQYHEVYSSAVDTAWSPEDR